MLKLMTKFKLLLNDETGQGLMEYGLLAFLIGTVAIASIGSIGSSVASLFSKIVSAFQ
jgi:pilus assembly protein Flp/PilA